jgi:hypothetical protein
MENPSKTREKFYGDNSQYYLTVFNPLDGRGQLTFFEGLPVQKGSGISTDLFVKYALPLITKTAPHVYKGVSQVIDDVNQGKLMKTALKRRGLKTLKRVAQTTLTGEGKMKKAKIIETGRKKLGKMKNETKFTLFD